MARHPRHEAIARTAADKRAAGIRAFLVDTAHEFNCSKRTVQRIMRDHGVLSEHPTGTYERPRRRAPCQPVRLTAAEIKAIMWCPECGHIHVKVPCEWCANWDHAKRLKVAARVQKRRIYQEERSKRMKAYFTRYSNND